MAGEFKPGDAVVHGLRPDWGVGSVVSAVGTTHNGAPCQRIEARFPGAGRRTLLTAVAPLRTPGKAQAAPTASPPSEDSPETVTLETLWTLPEEVTDPFRSEIARLESAIRFCRFDGRGGALLDWAQLQTGLQDPLSRFTRHELEEAWVRFRRDLEREMGRLLGMARQRDPGGLARLLKDLPADVRETVRRLRAPR